MIGQLSGTLGQLGIGGTVSEKYGGEFVVNADVVRATE